VHAPSRGLNGTRWLVFNTIGAIGLFVQLACLWTLRHAFHLHYLVAALLAIELAIVHNFFWHWRWTWADRVVAPADLVRRFIRFNLTNGAISIIGNLVLMAALVELANTPYLLAHLLSVAACSWANFVVSDIVVFGVRSAESSSPDDPRAACFMVGATTRDETQ
jgi:putative flippase GtrA